MKEEAKDERVQEAKGYIQRVGENGDRQNCGRNWKTVNVRNSDLP